MKWILASLAGLSLFVTGLCPIIDAQVICDQFGCYRVAPMAMNYSSPPLYNTPYAPISYSTPSYSAPMYGSTVYSTPTYGYADGNCSGALNQVRSFGDGNCSGTYGATYGDDLWKDPNCSGTYSIRPVYSTPAPVAPLASRPVYGYTKTRVTPYKSKTVQRVY